MKSYLTTHPPACFVQFSRGLWIKTDVAVAFAACPVCKAGRDQLCMDKNGRGKGSTHASRRYAASQVVRRRAS